MNNIVINSKKLLFPLSISPIIFAMGISSASASPLCTASNCSDVLITKFMPFDNGTLYIETDGDKTPLTCSLWGGVQMFLPSTGKDRLYSFLMTAYFNKIRLTIRLVDNSNPCTIGYAY